MSSLEINFGGLRLKNPVLIASAPPTETVDSIARCADAGAAAVVTKTIAAFDEGLFPLGARRARLDKRGLWAMSTFRRETLTLDAGIDLVRGVAQIADIPIIASVGALDMEPESWLSTCLALEEAGAKMLQLDLFYVPHPRCSPESISRLKSLLAVLTASVHVPIAPKLNIEIPAHYAVEILRDMPVPAVFGIDSIRVPPPLQLLPGGRVISQILNSGNAGECSLFGPWQKPITLQYTRVLAEGTRIPICAGGGFMNGGDAIEAIMLGATAVQYATAIIQRGFSQIGVILREIQDNLDNLGYSTVEQIRGIALTQLVADERGIAFGDMKAQVRHDLCILCEKCTTQVFCSDIVIADKKVVVKEHCDGCGLCVEVCPTKPKALMVVPSLEWSAGVSHDRA